MAAGEIGPMALCAQAAHRAAAGIASLFDNDRNFGLLGLAAVVGDGRVVALPGVEPLEARVARISLGRELANQRGLQRVPFRIGGYVTVRRPDFLSLEEALEGAAIFHGGATGECFALGFPAHLVREHLNGWPRWRGVRAVAALIVREFCRRVSPPFFEQLNDAAIGRARAERHAPNGAGGAGVHTGQLPALAEAVRHVLHVLFAASEGIDGHSKGLGHQPEFMQGSIAGSGPCR